VSSEALAKEKVQGIRRSTFDVRRSTLGGSRRMTPPLRPPFLIVRLIALGLLAALAADRTADARSILHMGGGSPAASIAASGGSGGASATSSRGMLAAQSALSRASSAVTAVHNMQMSAHQLNNPLRTSLFPGVNLPVVQDGLNPNGLNPNLSSWTGANAPTTPNDPNTVVVVQKAQQAFLSWNTFNVGPNTTLNFDQGAGGTNVTNWIAFNQISPTGVPSQIMGKIQTLGPSGAPGSGGQVYIINPNGIIFGPTSQVNAHSLIVSSLPINTNLTTNGLVNNPDSQFLFSALTIPAGTVGNTPAFNPPTMTNTYGDVEVQPGALLKAIPTADNTGGLVALIGPNVYNGGTISTQYGQTILAAGYQVGVAPHASNDPTLRGLDAYVGIVGPRDPNITSAQAAQLAGQPDGGIAENADPDPTTGAVNPGNMGYIQSNYGDTMMVGQNVNQYGIIDSLTSVSYNGRVDLLAEFGTVPITIKGNQSNPAMTYLNPSETGMVALGPGSVTQILPDMSAQTAVGTQLALPSLVDIQGGSIELDSEATADPTSGAITGDPGTGALLLAPGANAPVFYQSSTSDPTNVAAFGSNATVSAVPLYAGITLSAGTWSGNSTTGFIFGNTGGSVTLAPGATIDVSGAQVQTAQGFSNVGASVQENIVPLQLLGAQLANSPLQRSGALYRQTVNVDITQTGQYNGQYWAGTPLADTTGFINQIQRTVGELTTNGGTVALAAGNAINLDSDSTINVSASAIHYAGGLVSTSKVIADGHILDIANATPDLSYGGVYTGTYTTTDAKWGVTQIYTSPLVGGANAGHYVQSYDQWGNAGSIAITAPSIAINGNFYGNTNDGPYQRTPLSQISSEFGSTSILPTMAPILGVPMAGALTLNFEGQTKSGTNVTLILPSSAPDIYFQSGANHTTPGSSPTPTSVVLSTGLVNEDGFGNLMVYNPGGNIEIQDDLNFPLSAGGGDNGNTGNGITGFETGANPYLERFAISPSLENGGNISLTGTNITIDSGIKVMAPAGALSFTVYGLSPFSGNSTDTANAAPALAAPGSAQPGQFDLGAGATVTTAGTIVDDRTTAAMAGGEPLLINGGAVTIDAYQIDLQSDSQSPCTIDVSGGVQVGATGKLTYGSGGNLTLSAQEPSFGNSDVGLSPDTTNYGFLKGLQDTTLRGYSGNTTLGSGGNLSITAPFIQVGGEDQRPQQPLLNGDATGRTLLLNQTDANGTIAFFNQGGFSTFSLTGLGGFVTTDPTSDVVIPFAYLPAVVIAPDTHIEPQVTSWLVALPASGSPQLIKNSTPSSQLIGQRTPVNLMFNASGMGGPFLPDMDVPGGGSSNTVVKNEGLRGDVVVYPNAVIQADPELNGSGSVALNGTTVTMMTDSRITARGGKISVAVALPGGGTANNFFAAAAASGPNSHIAGPVTTVDLGPGSVLDASGAVITVPKIVGDRTYTTGTVLPGGKINVSGNIVIENNATLNVNGASTSSPLYVLSAQAGKTTTQSRNLSGSGLTPVTEESDGGSISLAGSQDLVVDPTVVLEGFAGGWTLPGGSIAQGGSLAVSCSGIAGANATTASPALPALFLTPSDTPFYLPGQNVTATGGQPLAILESGQPEFLPGQIIPTKNGQPVTMNGQAIVAPGQTVIGNPVILGVQVASDGTPVLENDGTPALIYGSGGYFGASIFKGQGFDSLTLATGSNGATVFSGNVDLAAKNHIAIGNSGVLFADPTVSSGSSLTLQAAYVSLGQSFLLPGPNQVPFLVNAEQAYVPPTYGLGGLAVKASDLIDIGNLSLQNIGMASFDATVDANGNNGATNGAIRGDGTLDVAGAITMTAGQIYPPTATTFNIAAYTDTADGQVNPGSVTIYHGPGAAPALPLSAGGTLNIYATNIYQYGVLRAPIGVINLGALNGSTSDQVSGNNFPVTQTLNLESGSTTSVSAFDPLTRQDLTIPYGIILNGTDWIDPTGTKITTAENGPAGTGLPAGAVNLTATSVTTSSGSTIDLTGGGDLYAYRWLPGLGGSYDILNASYNANGSLYNSSSSTSFAVIPGYSVPYAPFASYNVNTDTNPINSLNFNTPNPNPNDPTGTIIDAGYTSNGLVVDQQIYLNPSNGLPAGTYTLLPARYALLPGAFLVTPQGAATATPSTASLRTDGSSLVAGYKSNGLSQSRSPLFSAFEVDPQSVVLSRAEYDPSTANNFFTQSAQANHIAVPRLPSDAGQLVFNVTGTLNIMAGTTVDAQAPNGLGGLVDINSPGNIFIEPNGASSPGNLFLDPRQLDAFNAESLLVGGVRQTTSSGTMATIMATNLTVENNGTDPLQGSDVILAANNGITLVDGSVVTALNTPAISADALQVGQTFNFANGPLNVRSGSVLSFPTGLAGNDTFKTTGAGGTITPPNGGTSITFGAGATITSSMLTPGSTITFNSNGGSLNSLAFFPSSSNDTLSVTIGDGALLRVSSDPSASVTRAGVTGSTNPTMTIGSTLSGAQGVTITGASVTLDSTGTTKLGSNVELGGTGNQTLNLNSGRISLQLPVSPGPPQPNPGLVLSSDQLQNLQAASLSLLSYSSIDIYGSSNTPLTFLGSLALHAGEIRGFSDDGNGGSSGGGSVTFSAHNILLDNSANGNVPGQAVLPSGGLTFDAGTGTIELGANQLNIDQYGGVTLQAGDGITVQGTGGLTTQGSLAMKTPLLTTASGARQTITAGATAPGSLSVTNPGGTFFPAPNSLGGNLTLIGAQTGITNTTLSDDITNIATDGVTIDSSVVVPSGTLSVEAVHGDLSVYNFGKLDVGGTPQTFFDKTEYTSGGQITLTSDKNNVNLNANNKVNVAAQSEAGSAGSLTISAPNGHFSIPVPGLGVANVLSGQGGAGGQAGTFSLEVASLSQPGSTSLDSLADILDGAGFTHSISIRDRGDTDQTGLSAVTLDQGKILTAHTVNLSADAGSIDIKGEINASGDVGGANAGTNLPAQPTTNGVFNWDDYTGGSISLSAFGRVALESTATLDASGSYYNDASQGGSITISAGVYDSNTPQTALTLTPSSSNDYFVSNPTPNGPAAINLGQGSNINLAVTVGATNNPFTTSDIVAWWAARTNQFTSGSPAPGAYPTDSAPASLPSGGTLLLSAPQTSGSSPGIAIGSVDSTIMGSPGIVVEGYKVYMPTNGVIDTIDAMTGPNAVVYNDAQAFFNPSNISFINALFPNNNIQIQPGAEIVNPAKPVSIVVNGSSSMLAPGASFNTSANTQLTNFGVGDTFFVNSVTGATKITATVNGGIISATGMPIALTANTPTLISAGSTVSLNNSGNITFSGGASITNSTGNLTLNNTWDLSTFRFGPGASTAGDGAGEPGILTLRAAGNLVFNYNTVTKKAASLSDGFEPTSSGNGGLWQAPLQAAGNQSWSYNLVAGADPAAADYRRVVSGAGSLQLGYGYGTNSLPASNSVTINQVKTLGDAAVIEQYYQAIRTGTGNINIFAGQDVQLLDPLAAIYTAGSQASGALPSNELFDVPQLAYTIPNNAGITGLTRTNQFVYPAQYSQNGGTVTISAQHDIAHELLNTATNQTFSYSSLEMPTNWLYRRGDMMAGAFVFNQNPNNTSSETASTTWWIDFSNFFEGVGALGGGNVILTAGHDVANVDAVAPTNARVPYQMVNGNAIPVPNAMVELGGGDVTVTAGNNINGGVYYVERGQGVLNAGNQILTNSTRAASGSNTGMTTNTNVNTWLPTALFLGQGSFNVTASDSILLGPVANPFLLPQGVENTFFDKSYFSTYATTDAVNVSSLAGNVTLQDSTASGSGSLSNWYAFTLGSNNSNSSSTPAPWLGLVEASFANANLVAFFNAATTLVPGTLQATAFSGNLNLAGNFTFSPSPNGTIDFAAAQSINGLQPNSFLSNTQSWASSKLNLSDVNPNSLPNAYTPFSLAAIPSGSRATPTTWWASGGETSSPFEGIFTGLFAESGTTNEPLQTQETLHGTSVSEITGLAGPLHVNDTTGAIELYATSAANGSISGLQLFAGKAAHVVAGQDITDIALYLQNDNPTDTSVVNAGRDILAYYTNSPLRTVAGNAKAGNSLASNPETGDIQIAGPGTLEVLAGRNLTLGISTTPANNGLSTGITSIGSASNPELLQYSGANVVAGAGLGSPAPGLGATGSQLGFQNFIDQYLSLTSTYWPSLLPNLQALAPGTDFSAGLPVVWPELTESEQQLLAPQILDTFYFVLRDAGRNHSKTGNYNTGFSAIADLFPANVPWQGDMTLTSREIKTEDGGDIDVLVPGGRLTVGLPVSSGSPVDQGILTDLGGNISIFTNGNVTVGVSRIFTLHGGNEIIWSTTGNIAAGAASKTVSAAPPTRVLVDPTSAAVKTDPSGLATGGGIGVLASIAGVKPGDVDLIAPNGFVDAGDAGIRASGSINIAAVTVLNSSNISAGGTVTGTPPPPAAPNIGALASASNTVAASSGAANEAAKQQHASVQPQQFPSIITVEVLGYGGGGDDDDSGS
jgi:filamentous hemagglutinin